MLGGIRKSSMKDDLELGFEGGMAGEETGWPGTFVDLQVSQWATGSLSTWRLDSQGGWIVRSFTTIVKGSLTIKPRQDLSIGFRAVLTYRFLSCWELADL